MASISNTPTYNDYPHYEDNLHGEDVIMIHEQEQQLVYHYPMSLRLLSLILSLLFGFLSCCLSVGALMLPMMFDSPNATSSFGPWIGLIIYISIMIIIIRMTTVFIYITWYGITPKSFKAPYNTKFNIMLGCCCFDESQRLQYTTNNNNINYHNLNVEMR